MEDMIVNFGLSLNRSAILALLYKAGVEKSTAKFSLQAACKIVPQMFHEKKGVSKS